MAIGDRRFPGIRAATAAAGVLALLVSCTGDDAPGDSASPAATCGPTEEVLAITTGGDVPAVDIVQPSGVVGRPTGSWTASRPALSPDGRRLAVVRAYGDYESAGPGAEEIWTIGLDGSDPVQLTEGGNAQAPSWSPDGSQIAFASYDGDSGGFRIAVIDAGGSGEPALLTDGAEVRDLEPQWSPDGSTIAFVRSRRDGGAAADVEVVLVDPDGSDLRPVAALPRPVDWLTWVPDGESLLASSGRDGLRSVDLDGTVREVHPQVFLPAFSPAGDRVTYVVGQTDGRLAQGRYVDGDIVRDRWVEGVDRWGHPYGFGGIAVGPCAAAPSVDVGSSTTTP